MRNSVTKNYNGHTIVIGAYKGVPCYKWGGWCYKHKIVIECNGKKANFPFYNSQYAYSNGQQYLNEKDIINAFDCIINDAIDFNNSVSIVDFLNEFGYEEDNLAEGKRVFRGCAMTFTKLEELGLTTQDIYDIANYLRDELND